MAWSGKKSSLSEFPWSLPAGFSNKTILLCAVGLSLFGLLMIYSASAVLAMQRYGDGLYFVKKQAIFLLLGWVLYFVVAQIPVLRLSRYRHFFLLASVLLLLAVFIPGLGITAGGARRWMHLGLFQLQPAELVRLFLVFYFAGAIWARRDRLDSFNKGFLPFLIVTSGLMFLLVLQPDFGSAMGIFLISATLWFVGGVPLTYLAGLLVLALPALLFILFQASYRVQRVLTFLDPWKDPQGAGFQVIQSFSAFHEGGWTGVGLGNSQQKLFYLPEAHTDFIFSVIGEELGVLGASLVLVLFISILWAGARVARSQVSVTGYLLAAGMSVFICLPALLNMFVATGLLPTKGLPLPFFSYGGSSLIAGMMALGALQSLSSRAHEEDP